MSREVRHEWSVYTVEYVAVRQDGVVKPGDHNTFQASSLEEVLEKLRVRGLDPAAVKVIRNDYTETRTGPFEVKL